jgi:hypothetical protein
LIVVGVVVLKRASARPSNRRRTSSALNCARMARPMLVAWAGKRVPTVMREVSAFLSAKRAM